MLFPATFEVMKVEVHHLPSCPCEACTKERARILSLHSPPPGCISITPLEAFHLGFINRQNLTASGSVARRMGCEISEEV